MEEDLQIPYTVLTLCDLRKKMNKQIDEISQIFWVSRSNATILLMNLRWDTLRVSESLSEDKDLVFTKSGLKPIVTDTYQDSSCDEFYEFEFDDDDDDDDGNISTPCCSHKFTTSYWSEYLDKNFFSLDKTKAIISCPDQDCVASVGPETIEKLTIRDKVMYESYLLKSYLEENNALMIKKCPAQGCSYVIEFRRAGDVVEYGLNVVCLCGHTFCWRCSIESHTPMTCNNTSDWLCVDLKNLLNLSWIGTNTKNCPHCLCLVALDRVTSARFLTCFCSGSFCSKCLRTKEDHQDTLPNSFEKCVKLESQVRSRAESEISCVDLWEAFQVSTEEAKADLRAFEEQITKKPSSLQERSIRLMREGLMLIVQSRQVLKWSCVYDYLHTDYELSKREHLRFLQEYATSLLQSFSETLKEETAKAFSENPSFLSSKISTLSTETSDIGNYFYHFVKAVEGGLSDVKVRSYDNVAGPYWFCDRCTYKNTWFHKECKMCCCDGLASSVEELSGLSLE
ncbi:unnamed protein product [Cochlearia groenlandica]